MNGLPGYLRAQQEWENRLPPEDGPSDCQNCNAKGVVYTDDTGCLGSDTSRDCAECDGFGQLLNGAPYDDSKAQSDADD